MVGLVSHLPPRNMWAEVNDRLRKGEEVHCRIVLHGGGVITGPVLCIAEGWVKVDDTHGPSWVNMDSVMVWRHE